MTHASEAPPDSGPASSPQRLPFPFDGRFAAFLAVRGLTVVNDNAVRWLAIGLGKRACQPGQTGLVLMIGTAGFVLPFVLLAWLAGYLADRYPKRAVVRWCKAAEILIAVAAAAVVAWGVRSGGMSFGLPAGLWLLLGCVGVIGCQAAIMAPSLVGTIPETSPPTKLAEANGLFAMVGLVATLAGMAAGNWLADGTVLPGPGLPGPGELHSAPNWAHAMPVAVVLVGFAVAGWLASLLMAGRPAAAPQTPPPHRAFARTLADLRELATNQELAAATAGIVFFWAIAAAAQLNVDQFAAEAGATTQGQVVPLLVALVGGIGVGSLFAGRSVPGRGADLGLVPFGAALMAASSVSLALGPSRIFSEAGAGPFAWWHAVVSLAALGLGAGLFDVPLEAFFQQQSPGHRRGSMLAAANLLVFVGMFAASVLYGLLRVPFWPAADVSAPLVSARGIFALFAMLATVAAAASIYAAPRASLRWFVGSIVRTFYRFRVRNAELLPATGPAVIVANHLSWLDGFLLPLASPRPVRMVVYGPNIRGKFLQMLSDQWRFILFDPRPKSIGRALKTIQAGLADGDVIGIFCEGGISRTGQILGFKRGLEWLLSRVDAPIVPAHIDGMWGSVLSFSEGRYFTKWPRGFRRPLTLSFGGPLPVGTHPDVARLALQELTADSVRRRLGRKRRTFERVVHRAFHGSGVPNLDPVAIAATVEAFDGCCLVRRADRLLVSLAPSDPLACSLGRLGGELLGIRSTAVGPSVGAAVIRETLEREGITIWLARVEQVLALSEAGPAPSGGSLVAVVVPIANASELPAAEDAARRFREAFGVEPVVAYAPDGRSLVAMHTPPGRSAPHEVTSKAGSVGRAVNGVVVWPSAAMRPPLGLPPIEGVDGDSERTLVVAATLPSSFGNAPAGMLLGENFDIDADGFLVRREGLTEAGASGGR